MVRTSCASATGLGSDPGGFWATALVLESYTYFTYVLLLQMEVQVSEMLSDDVEALRTALDDASDNVSVTLSLPRRSAEKVLALLDAERTTGAVVLPAKELFSTTEAALMLGLSRPTLMKIIAAGEIEHVKVGTHHRIPARALLEFQRARRVRRQEAAEALAELSNEIGLVD